MIATQKVTIQDPVFRALNYNILSCIRWSQSGMMIKLWYVWLSTGRCLNCNSTQQNFLLSIQIVSCVLLCFNFPVLAKTKFFEGCSQYFWSSQIMAKFTSRKHRSQGWVHQLQNYEPFIFMAAIIITYWEFKGTNPQYHRHHCHNHHYHYHQLCCSRRKAILKTLKKIEGCARFRFPISWPKSLSLLNRNVDHFQYIIANFAFLQPKYWMPSVFNQSQKDRYNIVVEQMKCKWIINFGLQAVLKINELW